MQEKDDDLGGGEFIQQNLEAVTGATAAQLWGTGCSDPEGHAANVVERITEELKGWRDVSSPRAAVYWLIPLRVRDHARRCRREVAGDIDEKAEPLFVTPGESPEDIAASAEFVEQTLSPLREEERLVVEMHLFNELSHDAIARLLKKPPGTVRSLYARALRKLKTPPRKSGGVGRQDGKQA